MKKLVIFISILSIAIFSSCSNSNTNASARIDYTSLGLIDKTAKFETFNPNEYDIENAGQVTISASKSLVFYNETDLYQYEQIRWSLYGKVVNVENWDGDGEGHTIYDFEVKSSYKGDIKTGTVISIITQGGYCRLSQAMKFDKDLFGKEFTQEQKKMVDTMVWYSYVEENPPMPQIGQEMFVFLWQDPESFKLYPEGVYLDNGYDKIGRAHV